MVAARASGSVRSGGQARLPSRLEVEGEQVASQEQCREALEELAGRLAAADGAIKQHVLDRTVSCHVPDLGVTFHGRLADGDLQDITTVQQPPAQIRLTVHSEDLVELVAGRLPFAHAWATGRIKLDASLRDLLKLRGMF